jgi:hypothetical protein
MKTESHLAKELGVNRNILKEMRKEGLIATSSWEKASNQIVYHEEGEDEVREILKAELSTEKLSDPLPPPDEPREMVITKLPLNPRMVICGDIRVKVRENKNFLIGMKVNARPSMDNEQVWVMVGRCPRWRGRY